jgi:predicted DNA-binding transcriptional regulator AlpA
MAATIVIDLGEFMSKINASKYLGLSISTLRRLTLSDKTFPKPKRVLRRDMFRRTDLDEWKSK